MKNDQYYVCVCIKSINHSSKHTRGFPHLPEKEKEEKRKKGRVVLGAPSFSLLCIRAGEKEVHGSRRGSCATTASRITSRFLCQHHV